ncbi:hypothetical protein [Variovorax guangxiensis]|uniref:hypothetical protein n=1 Tax=Variovorax guangxiensis TaxID=1775474 RepID=UPI0028613CE5|nr:hypothetical protein [Variovorax guangxiensis]MDR6855540.1 hypothetical protein [Variovorax guangxiensis]
MSRLNQVDIAILQRYVDRGERLACWNYLDAINLRQTGCHDAYAVLAAQIVWSTAAARRYEAIVAAELQFVMPPDDEDLVELDWIKSELDIRRNELEGGQGLVPDSEVPMSGTVSVTQSGELLFTPDTLSGGAMSFTLEIFKSGPSANDGIWSSRT